MAWLATLIDGLLVGGLYALYAVGLSLGFGIMRLVNIAHGDLIVLAAYLALLAATWLGLPALLSLIVVLPAMAAIGYGLQRVVFNRTLGGDILPPLLVTFGLSIMLQNGLMQAFSADSRRVAAGTLETASVALPGGLAVGVLPLLQFAVAVAVIGLLQLLFYRTGLGRAFRATADNPTIARTMGINDRHVYALALAVAMAVTGLAGVFLAIRTNFDPTIGPGRLLFAFEAVIIGGLGSLWGTLLGGMILGVAQGFGARIDPGFQILAGHVVFLLVLVLRPAGLFPRVAE